MKDIIPLLLVYAYVATLVLISENLIKTEFLARKFLHIMVGNIVFLLPFFESREVMAFLAAFPFVILTFLMTPYSPVKLGSRTTISGHYLGLFYYSIAWTILAYFLFHRMDAISLGIVAMSYGDAFASIVGVHHGKKKFKVFGDTKSLEGSLAMLLTCIVMFSIVSLYYTSKVEPILFLFAVLATFFEAITPKGLDNLSVSLSVAFLYSVVT